MGAAMTYEILDDKGNVINTIVADQQFVEENYPGHYRLVPDPVSTPPTTWIITKLAMITRFTNPEYVGIVSAKKTDVTVEAWYDAFYAAANVNLQDQRCIDGVNFLVSKNLLTQARATEILTTPAKYDEIPS